MMIIVEWIFSPLQTETGVKICQWEKYLWIIMILAAFYELVSCLVSWFDINISHIPDVSVLQEPSESLL